MRIVLLWYTHIGLYIPPSSSFSARYLVICVSCLLVMIAFQSDAFVGSIEQAWATFLVMLCYGLAAIPLSYCYSFLFSSHSSAQIGICGLNFVSGFVFVIASFILENTDEYVEEEERWRCGEVERGEERWREVAIGGARWREEERRREEPHAVQRCLMCAVYGVLCALRSVLCAV